MKRARTGEEKELRRIAFLDAALDVFFEKGFAAAKIDEICVRAGVSKGVLYLYFDSKQALLEALFERYAVPQIDQIVDLADNTDPMTAVKQITEAAGFIVRKTPVPRLVKILIGEAGNQPQIAQIYRQRIIERGLDAFSRLIERGMADGHFKPGHPPTIARLVVAPVVFSMIWTMVFEKGDDDRLDVDALLKTHGEMMLSALAPEREVRDGAR